jgi:signal transduction histidine kinase
MAKVPSLAARMSQTFKDLRTSTKLLLLCGMFGISIAVTTAALVAEKEIAIAFAEKELVGSRYLATVRDLYQPMLVQQEDPSFAQQTSSSDELLKGLDAAEAKVAGQLQTTDLKQALTRSLRKLWSNKADRNADQAVLEALSSAQKLASRIGDDSNLTLDPDLDTYYVQNILVERLPALVSQLGEMQTLIRKAIANGSLAGDHIARLNFLDSSIGSITDGVKSDLAAAYRGNPDGSLRRNVETAIETMIANIQSYFGAASPAHIGDEIKNLDLDSVERAFSSALGNTVKNWMIVQTELDRLLQLRIDNFEKNLRLSLALIGVLVGASILLAIMTHRHVVSSLGHLEKVVAKVRASEPSSGGGGRTTKDEFNSLTSAFNDMLAELATAREREIADQARSAQQKLLATMGQMAASIAHELNQPLAAIVTNGNAGLRWLGNTAPDLGEVGSALKRIVSDGHRASQVIGTIRSMFRKDGQKKAPVDVNQLIQEVLGLLRDELRNQRVSLRSELEAHPIQVLGDHVQLQQVILNLMTNAIDAMASISDRPRVLRVRSETDESNGVAISVEDSGVGIDPKDADRIFDTFYTTKPQGMGIGLAICRSIIEAHGGRISASSGNPHGSIFQVVLPTYKLQPA